MNIYQVPVLEISIEEEYLEFKNEADILFFFLWNNIDDHAFYNIWYFRISKMEGGNVEKKLKMSTLLWRDYRKDTHSLSICICMPSVI